MRSWQFHKFGELENLQCEDVPVPEPGPGEILLRVHFASLNPADQFLVRGLYPGAAKPPYAVGRDAAGTVAALGAGCSSGLKVGDAVHTLVGDLGVTRTGTLSDFVCVPETMIARVPAGWTLEEAAAGPLTHLTAWRALVDMANVQPGEEVLITGASGGVGSAAVVLAKALGARVIALSRSAEKRERLEAIGADLTFDPADEKLIKRVQRACNGPGPNVVVENLGGDHLAGCLRMVAPHARIQVVGLLADFDTKLQLGLLIHKRVKIEGIHVNDLEGEAARNAWKSVVLTLEKAGRRPLVDEVFAADAVHPAFARLATGPMGKVLVSFGDEA